jgi:cytochrome c556
MRKQVAVIAVALFASVALSGGVARTQDTGLSVVKDAIFARKTLMNSICDKMTEIEMMISLGRVDMAVAQRQADAISVMLMAFPHLFPAKSNRWQLNVELDPGFDTYASPDIWAKFSDFSRQAAKAANTALQMSRTDDVDEFKTRARELRIVCDACHGMYSELQ